MHPVTRVRQWRNVRVAREEALEWHHANDPQANLESDPPNEERILFRSLWVLEHFAPSNIGSLATGIKKRGWDKTDILLSDPAALIRRWRQGGAGGWHLLGTFSPSNSHVLGTTPADDLPEGVLFASLELHSVTSTVTALLGHFDLAEPLLSSLDNAVRTHYETHLERTRRGGFTIVDPSAQKQLAAREALRMAASDCFSWMTKDCEGVFTLDGDSPRPAWAFVTLDKGVPFSGTQDGYLRALGISHDFEAWEDPKSMSGFRLAPPSFQPELRHSMIMAANEPSLAAGGRDPSETSHWLHNQLRVVLVAWGATELLAVYRRRLADVRDSLAEGARHRPGVVKRLRTARRRLLTVAADAQQVALQFGRWTRLKEQFAYDMPNLSPVDSHAWNVSSFPELVRRVLEESSDLLGEEETEIRSLLVSSSAMESAGVNIRLQRAVTWLTWVLVLIGGAAIWVSYWAVHHTR